MKPLQHGYTLLELALTLVVAGLVVTIGASLYHQREQTQQAEIAEIQFGTADQALLGYVFANNALPCPAADNSGLEARTGGSCSSNQGLFPFRTLGIARQLRNGAGVPLRYAVYNNLNATPSLDASLSLLQDRFRPFYSETFAAPQPKPLGNRNGLDLCHALLRAQSTNTTQPDTVAQVNDGARNIPVAYVLVDPGQSNADNDPANNLLDGSNASASDTQLRYNAPGTAKGLNNDDRTHVMYFSQLYQQMGCSEFISSAGTSHPNVLTTATLLKLAMDQQRKQLALTVASAAADVLQAAAAVASATGGVASAAASTASALTEILLTSGANSGGIVLASASVVASAAGMASAALTTAAAIAAQVLAAENLVNYDKLRGELNGSDGNPGLLSTIRQNVHNADGRGIYQ